MNSDKMAKQRGAWRTTARSLDGLSYAKRQASASGHPCARGRRWTALSHRLRGSHSLQLVSAIRDLLSDCLAGDGRMWTLSQQPARCVSAVGCAALIARILTGAAITARDSVGASPAWRRSALRSLLFQPPDPVLFFSNAAYVRTFYALSACLLHIILCKHRDDIFARKRVRRTLDIDSSENLAPRNNGAG